MEFILEEAIPVLERTPAVLSALLEDVPEAWLDAREGPEAWSPGEIVGHLINGERTDWIPRARIILKQGSYRRFEPFDRVRDLTAVIPPQDHVERVLSLVHRHHVAVRVAHEGILADIIGAVGRVVGRTGAVPSTLPGTAPPC